MRIKEALIGLLYPKRCPVCHDVVEDKGELVCRICRTKLLLVRQPACRKCGKPLLEEEREYCQDCTRKHHEYRQGRAAFIYDERMRRSIAKFKYEGRREYAAFYAEEIVRSCGREAALWQAQALVPVPLHPSRRRKRGFNQAEVLAEELSRWMRIPVERKILIRSKKTRAQKQLNDQERVSNLKNAFSVRKGSIPPKTIILVDDIYTTGSTIDEAARVLLENGAQTVYFLCICVGRGS